MLPPLAGRPIRVELRASLGPHLAATHIPRRVILLDAGLLVVSTTNAIGLADHGAVQALIPDAPSIVIDVDPAGDSLAPCDLRIRGTEPEDQVIEQIGKLLVARQITAG